MRNRLVFLVATLLTLSPLRVRAADPAPAAPPAATPQPGSEMYLTELERQYKKELTADLQSLIVDKILGVGQAAVIVEVEIGLESKAMQMGMEKKKNDKKKNEGDDKEAGPAPAARMLVPGVPMPKSVASLVAPDEDRGGEEKGSGGQLQQKKLEVHTKIKKLMITVLYDKKVTPQKLVIVKDAIMQSAKVTDQQIVMLPTVFTNTAWQEVLTPKWLIPLIITLLILMFLWGPLRNFFKRLNAALEDKTQKIEQTLKQETEEESDENAEEEGDQDGQGGEGEGEGEQLDAELTPEEEEAMKKFEPFTYVGEQNLKGLAYLLRKEEPWIIALVLSYLKPEFGKEIFVSLPPELQARVAVETATIRQTSLEQVMSIDEYVKKKIDFVLGGIENLIKILNEADKSTRENILDYLRNEKPVLYERVREEVLLFEDILKFPDSAIQGIVREVGTETLSRAMRGAPPEFLNRLFSNMSAGASALLKESMDYGRPLTPEQVEDERKNLMELIGKLERDGKITVRKKRKAGILDGEEAADDSEPLHLQTPTAKATPKAASPAPSDPARAQECFQLGSGFYEAGRYPEAVEQFHYAIQAQGDFWQAYQYLGASYAAQGMVNEAAGAYERMLEISQDPSLRTWVEQWKVQMGLSRAEAV